MSSNYLLARLETIAQPRNMLRSSDPFRFQQEQFEFLAGDAFHYLRKWQLDVMKRNWEVVLELVESPSHIPATG